MYKSIAFILAFAASLPPSPPITEAMPVPAPLVTQVKMIEPMPESDFKPLESLAEVPVAVSTPAPQTPSTPAPVSSGGCVAGYTSGDYYLDKIISYESGGNSCATNPGGCFGLLQACPGAPLRAACGGDPVCQIEWFQANKTGGRSWAAVWQHELDFGWW